MMLCNCFTYLFTYLLWVCYDDAGSSSSSTLGMQELVMQLSALLDDESAVTVRLAVSSLKLCLPSLSLSHHSSLAVKLLLAVTQLKHNAYWLVKVSHTHVCLCLCWRTDVRKLTRSIFSSRYRLSYDGCLEDKRENHQNCSMLCCVRQLCTLVAVSPKWSH